MKKQLKKINNKICFVITSLRRSGAEKVVVSLANAYAEKGYDVSILMLLYNDIEFDYDKRIKVIDFSGKTDSRIKRIFYWIKSLKKYFKNNKGSVIVSFIARINILVLLSCKKKQHKIILSERNDPRYDRNNLTRLLVRFLYPKANLIVFQTEKCSKLFSRKIQLKSTVIPNPFYIEKFAAEIPANDKLIVSAGRLANQKDFVTLIKAMQIVKKHYSDYKLAIYGFGDEKNKLINLVNEFGLENNVTINDNVSNINEIMMSSFLYVSSSLYEGMSNSLLEASLSGIPVITTPCLGTEYIKNGYNGFFFNYKDYNQLGLLICDLIKDKNKYKKIRINAINYAKTKPLGDSYNLWFDAIKKIQ